MYRTMCTRSAAAKSSVVSSRYVLFFTFGIIFVSILLLSSSGTQWFDFLFLVAEMKRRRLDDTFSRENLYYADTLYDSRRVSGKHPT